MTSGRPLRGWLGLATAAVLLVSAAGCGTDDDEPETSASPSVAATVKSYERSMDGVVEASEVFLDTLDDDQKAEVQLELTEDNAVAWSDLPCGPACRPGLAFNDLDAHQLAAAKSVLKTALGSEPGRGYERVEELLLADDYLAGLQGGGVVPSGGPSAGASGGPSVSPSGGPSGGPGAGPSSGPVVGDSYGSGAYFLAFLGEPSTMGAWQLNFGGPHLAIHVTYRAGAVVGASPYYAGAEPAAWTDAAGASHAPLEDMRKALFAMTRSLNPAQQKRARLGQTFTEVLAGPQKDGQFPDVKQGLAVGSLTDAQKNLVLGAIELWVAGADEETATALLSTYEAELDNTYIAWSGTTGLNRNADYVRIDGPSVWVEFVCRNGEVVPDKIQCHTVYRDHTRDYGGEFSFS